MPARSMSRMASTVASSWACCSRGSVSSCDQPTTQVEDSCLQLSSKASQSHSFLLGHRFARPLSGQLAHQRSSRGDVRVGKRPVLELPRVLALESERLRIVTLEQGNIKRECQEVVRSKLEKPDIVMRRQRLALFVGEMLPRAAFALGQVQDDVGPLGFPPGDCTARVFAVALNQLWVPVDCEEALVEEILAHASTPFGYQVM